MKRNLTLFALALALTLGVTGCTKDKAPNVTPTPSPAATTTPAPTATPDGADGTAGARSGVNNSNAGTAIRPATPDSAARNGEYGADDHGAVRNGADMDRSGNAAGRVGDVARGAVDGVGDAVKGIGRGVEDIGNGISNATR